MKKRIKSSKKYPIFTYTTMINGRKISRDMLEGTDVAAIVAVKNNNIIIEKQNRFPNGTVIEIPSGTLNKGEKPIECAFREFKEETGYEAKKMKPLLTFYPQVGYTTHKVHCFVATGIKKTGMPKLDKEEFLDVMKINVEVLVKMILSGEIVDSITICAVLSYYFKKYLW